MYRIGWLQPSPVPDTWSQEFRRGLAEHGYVEGKNLTIEYRWGDGNFDQLPALAAELVRLNVELIVCGNTAGTQALQKATRTIPIVMLGPSDPVGLRLVASLARPGGNITGLSLMAPEVSGKRLELLKEVVPKLTRVTILSNPDNPGVVLGLRETEVAAETLGLKFNSAAIGQPGELDRVLSDIAGDRPDALVLLADSTLLPQRSLIAGFCVRHQLPSISPYREITAGGGLMSYGASIPDIHHRAAAYIDRILRGTNPADLPVQQPIKFELFVNLKTAKAIGLTISETFLVRADEVIE
jgi:putative ABC transport system substrate-binding protein